MKGSFSIGKIAGIGIFIHWSFFILVGLVLLPSGKSGQPFWNLAFVLTIFFCVVLHELGHALAARKFGIQTRDITLLPIGGVARLDRIPEKPSQELVVAIAGPVVNLVIALLLFPFVSDTMTGYWSHPAATINGENFFTTLFFVNISLAIFNLLPAFPMDGGRVFRALLGFKFSRVRATRLAVIVGQFIAAFFIIVGFMVNPILIFIGLFVIFGAQEEWLRVESVSWLSGHRVYDVTIRQVASVDIHDPLSKVVQAVLNSANHNFVVREDDKIVGTLGRKSMLRGLSVKGPEVTVGEVMSRNVPETDVNASIESALTLIQNSEDRFALVKENNALIGTVDVENIAEFIMVQQAVSKIK